jgi:hypothetical protein
MCFSFGPESSFSYAPFLFKLPKQRKGVRVIRGSCAASARQPARPLRFLSFLLEFSFSVFRQPLENDIRNLDGDALVE